MEIKYIKCLVIISLCFNGMEGKKVSVRARLTALEKLLNTQVYLLRDTIQSEIAQRDSLAQKVKETIEMMQRLQNESLLARTDKSEKIEPKYFKAKVKKLRKVITGDIVNEISEMLISHRRGLREEKTARKKDKDAIMNTLEQVSKELARDISDLKVGINEMKKEMSERTDRLEQKLDERKNINDARLVTSDNFEDQFKHTTDSYYSSGDIDQLI